MPSVTHMAGAPAAVGCAIGGTDCASAERRHRSPAGRGVDIRALGRTVGHCEDTGGETLGLPGDAGRQGDTGGQWEDSGVLGRCWGTGGTLGHRGHLGDTEETGVLGRTLGHQVTLGYREGAGETQGCWGEHWGSGEILGCGGTLKGMWGHQGDIGAPRRHWEENIGSS